MKCPLCGKFMKTIKKGIGRYNRIYKCDCSDCEYKAEPKENDLSKYRLGQQKSSFLKKCTNPECDNYFYGYKKDHHCSPKCQTRHYNIKTREIRNKWLRDKYRNDPIYRQKCIEYAKNYRLKNI